jgi:ABC-type nitrate/sulfonate/bicarbonate transport system substrate-binding protein
MPAFYRFFVFLCVFAVSLLGEDEITLRLKWMHQFQFAGYYMAIEKGFYAKEGLHVKLQEVNPKEGYLSFLKNTAGSYAIMDTQGVLDRLKGEPIVTLGAIF